MAWLEITAGIPQGQVEQIAAVLTCAGFSDLVIEDQSQFESFLQENRACWDYIDEKLQKQLQGLSRIRLYLEDRDKESLARLQKLGEEQGFSLEVAPLKEENWEESWKENYSAVEVGNRLVVLPYWLAENYAGSRLPVILDPGLTFGTGTHPSTQMVLSAMEQLVKPGSRCLDLGSGSGILSIAALRLGAQRAVGVDIDAKAEGIARENAALNGFAAPEFTALTGNVVSDGALMKQLSRDSFDVVLVNIVADVIIGLSPVLPGFLTESSTLICSGILDTRLDEVVSAIQSCGLCVTAIYEKEDWRCITAKRSVL